MPLAFKEKKKVLQSYVISKAIYFSPLLGSNKHRTARIQTLINTGLFWCIGSYTHKKTSAGTCAALQVKYFVKWRKSNCIIKDLIKYIPSLSHHSWTKESNILRNKLRKTNCKDVIDIKSHHWKNILKFQGIKGQSYENNKFLFNKQIIMFSILFNKQIIMFSILFNKQIIMFSILFNKQIIMFSIKYPHLNIGFSWIIRLRCGFSYNTIIAIRSGRVTSDCPKICPCCGQGEQSFDHWEV
ncbi:hypothetical protein PIROE2DRAFT_6845 [Piromyces sp. E2]|nr:hypothetical protein PIROE2DRAFT_6845 [Piromyces sp. E2]|eukprot:OUM66048.1 hypothetical protein PIROE2DRAFT_6845 [Piromyces sp. E2]